MVAINHIQYTLITKREADARRDIDRCVSNGKN